MCDVEIELSVKPRRSLFGTDKRFVSRVNVLFSFVLCEDDQAPCYVCKLFYDQINRLNTDKFKLERLESDIKSRSGVLPNVPVPHQQFVWPYYDREQ